MSTSQAVSSTGAEKMALNADRRSRMEVMIDNIEREPKENGEIMAVYTEGVLSVLALPMLAACIEIKFGDTWREMARNTKAAMGADQFYLSSWITEQKRRGFNNRTVSFHLFQVVYMHEMLRANPDPTHGI